MDLSHTNYSYKAAEQKLVDNTSVGNEQSLNKQSRFGFRQNSLLDQKTNAFAIENPPAKLDTQGKEIKFLAKELSNQPHQKLDVEAKKTTLFAQKHNYRLPTEKNDFPRQANGEIPDKPPKLIFKEAKNNQTPIATEKNDFRKISNIDWVNIENDVKSGNFKCIKIDQKNKIINLKHLNKDMDEADGIITTSGNVILKHNQKNVDFSSFRFNSEDENNEKEMVKLQNAFQNNTFMIATKDEFAILNNHNAQRLKKAENQDEKTNSSSSLRAKTPLPLTETSKNIEKKEGPSIKNDEPTQTVFSIDQKKNEKAASAKREEERELKKSEEIKKANKVNTEKIDERVLNNIKNK